MKFRLPTLACLVLLTAGSSGFAQTLTEKLLQESPEQLIADANKDGNIVRGAILFHQGNINCAGCHRPVTATQRLGPELSELGADVTDASIVESILVPSKKIREGFETMVAATIDGRLITGILQSEDDQQIVIRDSQNDNRPVTVAKADLEGMRRSEVSTMPAGLADQLENRKQFLDLLRYVIDLRQRGPSAIAEQAAGNLRRELSPALEGMILVQQHHCSACHQRDRDLPVQLIAKAAPKLEWSAKWLNPAYLEKFLAAPQEVKPGTTMPDVLQADLVKDPAQAARSLVHFLKSRTGDGYRPESLTPNDVAVGFTVFHEVGCVACHAPRDRNGVEQPLADSLPLGNLADKYSLSALVQFLDDPLAVRTSGHMPNMQLTHRESIEIASFLLQSPTEANDGLVEAWEVDPKLAEEGRTLFKSLRCANCHNNFVEDVPPQFAKSALEQLRQPNGCLSGEQGNWPQWNLSTQQRDQILAALQREEVALSNEDQIELTLKAYNCIACHQRNDLGGVTDARNVHFQTTNFNLGDQGRLPPPLTGVGAKLKSEWLREVLVLGKSVRPYMKTRMPKFGESNVGHLPALFASTDHLEEPEYPEFDDLKEAKKQGLLLVGNQGLNCVACHTYKFKPSDTMPAVDLTEMSDRLRKEWFVEYMLHPRQFSPNTVMPSFWPAGQAIRKDLDGTTAEQLEAIWQYLLDGRQAGTPAGVVREPLEIVVKEEAKMLRRKYPGIGKRGIGVGYPGDVNLAFDAEQLRLATIWKGKFVDPGGVWTGQGSGQVRPLGPTIEFPAGPDLDSQSRPWKVDLGRPPNHQFGGYRLDEQQRPTFLYRIGDVRIEDKFLEVLDEPSNAAGLNRNLLIEPGQQQEELRFRMAVGKIEARKGAYWVDGRLKIDFKTDQQIRVIPLDEDRQQLEVAIPVVPGINQVLSLDYRWE